MPLPEAAREIERVLKPGGCFLALDSVAPAQTVFASFHAAYLRHVVPLLGRLSPDPNADRYRSESIFDFGPPEAVARRLEDVGFETPVRVCPLLLARALFEGICKPCRCTSGRRGASCKAAKWSARASTSQRREEAS